MKLRLRRTFILSPILYFGLFYLQWMIWAFIPIHLYHLKFTELQIGILISTLPLASLMLLIPFGMFSDILPPKRLAVVGFSLLFAFFFSLIYITNFYSLLFLFLICGTATSLIRISSMTQFYKFLGRRDKGKKLGFFTGLGLFGYGLGPLTGGFLSVNFGMHSLFFIASFMTFPFIILSLFLEEIKPIKFDLREYGRDIRKREVIILAILTFLLSSHIGVEQTCLSLFLQQYVHLLEDSIGLMFFLIGITIAAFSIINGYISDVKGNIVALMCLGLFISGLFNINMFFVRTFLTVLAVRLAHVVGDSLFMVTRNVAISNIFQKERIGGNIGFINTVTTISIIFGALVSGVIPGYALPFVFIGCLALVAIIFAILTKPKFQV